MSASLFCIAAAAAETVVSTGVKATDQLLPFVSLSFDQEWVANNWVSTVKMNANGVYDNALGDAALDSEWHAETTFANALFLELDAAYGFAREKEEAIKQVHTLGGDLGIGYETADYRVKSDVGLVTVLHENTTQAGFASLDRALEDYWENEVAFRLTLTPGAVVQPFAEVALMQRKYFIESGRSFDGPEAIVGITLDHKAVSGDMGVIIASRQIEGSTAVHTISPYIDLKWLLQNDIEVLIAVTSGIDQDTSGPGALYSSYAARFEISDNLTEDLKISASLDAVTDLKSTGAETEVSPTLKFSQSMPNQMGYFATAGITFSMVQGEPVEVSPKLELGMNWSW